MLALRHIAADLVLGRILALDELVPYAVSVHYMLVALLAVPQFFFSVVIDILGDNDLFTALRAEHFTTETAMVLPPEEGDKLFVAIEAAGDNFIGYPVLPGTDQLPYRCFIIHYSYYNTP